MYIFCINIVIIFIHVSLQPLLYQCGWQRHSETGANSESAFFFLSIICFLKVSYMFGLDFVFFLSASGNATVTNLLYTVEGFFVFA